MYSAKILGYQFDTVFGLYLPEYVIPSPVVQTDYRQIPGMDGAIDKTEQFGAVRYKTRTWKLQFQKTGKNISSDDLFDLEQDLLNKVHGLSGQIIFDDDPDFYWKGRAFVKNVSCKNNGLLIADIELITDPYKYSFDNIVVSGNVVSETETYSGTVVTFDASAADSISNISVAISPVQDLNGYDQPWPAGGGANKINFANCTAGKTAFGLTSAISGEYFRFTGTCSSGGAHTWLFGTINSEQQSVAGNLNFKGFVISGGSGLVITAVSYNSSNGALSVSLGGLVTNQAYDFMLGVVAYEGSTAPTAWTPYSNICPISGLTGLSVYVSPTTSQADATIYAVDWTSEAGTVYGGTIDVATGLLTVTHEYLDDDGTLNWMRNDDGSFYTRNPGLPAVQDADGCACNYAPYQIGFDGMRVFFRANGLISLGKRWGNFYATADELKAAFAVIPIQFVYKLATPITYQLTQQEVEALLGTNNIWADAGDVTAIVQSMYVFNLQNNRKPIVPTVTNTENVQLVFTIQGVTYTKSLVPGNRKIVELVLFSGTTNVYAKGSGVVTFEYEDAQL